MKTKKKSPLFITILTINVWLVFHFSQKLITYSNSSEFCNACHIHPHSYNTWKQSVHGSNPDSIHATCVDCHLPPSGQNKTWEKIKLGSKDFYSYMTKDSSEFDWKHKSKKQQARKFTFQESCKKCHTNLYPLNLSPQGEKSHFYYQHTKKEVHCIDCHMYVGHGKAPKKRTKLKIKKASTTTKPIIKKVKKKESDTKHKALHAFQETITNTGVQFEMIPIPAGEFYFSEEKIKLKVKPFYISKTEISWNEFISFLSDTSLNQSKEKLDAVSGATPPFGDPSQGWGIGTRPAIMLTPYAAKKYCQWLSQKTGKTYRLPTEAEWEYAASANRTQEWYTNLDNKLNADEIIHAKNSGQKTQKPELLSANPWGLVNSLGNVWEICSDTYSDSAYIEHYKKFGAHKPYANGTEYTIKGGAFDTPIFDISSTLRESTLGDEWKKSDPQVPKSIWWYTDCVKLGFRIVYIPD